MDVTDRPCCKSFRFPLTCRLWIYCGVIRRHTTAAVPTHSGEVAATSALMSPRGCCSSTDSSCSFDPTSANRRDMSSAMVDRYCSWKKPIKPSKSVKWKWKMNVCMFAGDHNLFSLKLLRGGKQPWCVHQSGQRTDAPLLPVPSQPDNTQTHADTEVQQVSAC